MPIPATLLESPENQLLVLCARGFLVQSPDISSILSQVTDWHTATTRIHLHRLQLLLLHTIKGHEAFIPEEVNRTFQAEADKILHWNLSLMLELQEIARLTSTEDVHLLSYKGPAIAYSAYNTLSLRSFADLDLLVSPQQKTDLLQVLKQAGFKQVLPKVRLKSYIQRKKQRIEYETSLTSQDGLTDLDVHWHLAAPFESFPLTVEAMWSRRESLPEISGVETLCREDLIIALCFHGMKHLWRQLEWIGCLLGIIENSANDPIDWQQVERLARKAKCLRILDLGIKLVTDLAETEVASSSTETKHIPPHIRGRIHRDKTLGTISRLLWKVILGEVRQQNASSPLVLVRDSILDLYFGTWIRQGPKRRWRFCTGYIQSFLLSSERSQIVSSHVKAYPWLYSLVFEREANETKPIS